MMMNRPKRSPRKKQSPSFIYTATVKRSRKEDVETNKCISASGRKLSEKTATVNGAKNGAKKRLAKSTTSAIGAKKVIKKLFLNGKLQKRKRSPKQKTNSVESNEENATDEDCDTSRQLETLIEEKLDTELSHGDAPQMTKVKFHTERLQTWVDTFEEFYSEQHVKGMTCVPVTNKCEGGTEICIKKDCSNAASRDWIVVRFCGSDVMLQGSGLEQWKRTDFPALMDRMKNSVEKCVKEATGCGAQKLSIPSPAKKRSRLSLKSARVGRQDGGAVSKLAPLFKRCTSQKDGKQSQDAKSGNAKGLKNCEPGDTKDTPCVAALHNLGNTCFLNSVLQVLRYTPGFVDNISKLAKEVKLCGVEDTNNDDDEENLTWTLISNLDQVYKDMHEAEGRVSRCENSYLAVRPYQLMDTIEKLNPMFEGNLQQDAHELLRCLLSYVQDATKAVNKHRKTAKMASATASMALPVTPLDQKYNVKTENEMAKVVAAAVCMVMCSSKSSDTDGDKTSKSFDNDTDHAMKCVGVKREIGDGVVNEFKGQVSCKLNSQPSCNSRPLEGWVTKSLTKHVIVENTHLTNGWDTTEKNFNHNPAYGSTATFSETTEIGNRILSTSVGIPEKICRKKMSSSPIKCGTSISPLKAKRSLDLVTSSEASKKRINGKHVYENSALDMNGSADLEAQADLLSERLKLLTQSKSDTNICDLGHQQSTRWRSRSAGDVRGCGHVTKKRRTRGTTAGWRNQPDIMDMFSRQLTGGATNGVNGDNNVNMKERLLGKIRNVDEEISMSVTNVTQNGIVDNEAEICSTRNIVTHNTSCKNNIVKKQTARKSACGYFLSLSRHVNGNDDRSEHENRETTIPEEDIDQSMFSGTTVTESNSPRKKTCEELKSIALANGKSAVVRLRKSAVSDYFKTMAEKQQVADYVEDLFQGSMALRTRCLECEGFTERKEAYQDIGVPVRNERRDDDEEDSDSEETDTPHGWILAALDDVERLQDDNKYVCERCCHLVEAERSMHYVTLPRILTLHLKRFAATSRCLGGVTKINDHVRIPMILPCIQDGCRESCTTDNHRYELYAVVTHTGISISSGHYVAYVRMLPPTGKHDRDVDGSTNLHPKSETANFAVSVSNRIADYPGGDAVMADPNNNADTNNNVDVAPGTLLDTGVNNIVSPSGEQTEQPGDETMYWYGCDDDAITVLTQDELECILAPSGGGSPYLLFYHKVGLLQESGAATTA